MFGFTLPWDYLHASTLLLSTDANIHYNPLPKPTDAPDAQQEQVLFWNVIGNLQVQQTQTAQALANLLAALQITITNASTTKPVAPTVAPSAIPAPAHPLSKPLKF
jgi:hypothetical protein